ncbi:ribonuclease H-like domain-containing protein [Coniochaeta sp. 2T2.1]|nr:ribonuclease H-like domain-containing protein [Coniochaeta sp. 2T2.1]
MDASQDFKSLQDKIQGALVSTVRSAGSIANEDLSFLRTVDPEVSSKLDDNTARLIKLSEELLKSACSYVGQSAPSIEDADDIDISWRGVVDVIDTLLEKADTCLDEYTGLIKRKVAPAQEQQGRASKIQKPSSKLDWSMKRANIIKPQNAFERKSDNLDLGPWRPLLTSKPHAKLPLEDSLTTYVDSDGNKQYTHPYGTEIVHLSYPKRIYEKRDPIPYLPFESTTAKWVDTYEGVLEMLEELKKAKEIAVDLEHHDFRSYVGLTSLMQISTREKDWVVDTLRPWRHKLEVLNEVFADPSIIKVLHGAFMDIIWLQRDLGLYMVGLFDTHYACDALNYPGKGLAYLLKKFCDFDADKKYQMADWRLRPLPDEMFYYARSDTHYLLYIYDMVRNELVDNSDTSVPEKNWIEWVLQKSKEISLQRYETPLCDRETGKGSRGWFNVLLKSPSGFNSEQFAVYKAVFKWRDDLARQEDESPHFVMQQHCVADIARVLPADPKALWSLLPNVSQIVKSRIDELFNLIQQAKEKGRGGQSMMDYYRGTNSVAAVAKRVFGDRTEEKSRVADASLPDIEELKTERSQLWGDMPISSRWERDGTGRRSPLEEGEIALPWTTYVQGMAEQAMEVEPAEESKEVDMIPLQEEVPESVADEEFSLRQGQSKRGKKRKTEELEEEEDEEAPAPQQPSPTADTSTSTPTLTEDEARLAKKAARKARKLAKQLAKSGSNGSTPATTEGEGGARAEEDGQEEEEEEEEQPFDYSKAATVLHAQGNGTGGGDGDRRGRRGKKPKVFDPYAAKTQDNSLKGARKMNYEKSGRSATFKK